MLDRVPNTSLVKQEATTIGVKKLFLKILHYSQYFFNKVVIKKRLQHSCFSVNIAKLLRTSTLQNICERLPLSPISENMTNIL